MGTPAEGTKKNGTKKTVSELVLDYATTRVGHRNPGSGECWDLPYYALLYAKAKTPYDLGKDLYVWGEPIANLEDAQPGDILQFEGVLLDGKWKTGDGRMEYWEYYDFRGTHGKHSAIVEKVNKGLFFTTINAHVNVKKKGNIVQRIEGMNLSPELIKSGTIYLYRPIPGGIFGGGFTDTSR